MKVLSVSEKFHSFSKSIIKPVWLQFLFLSLFTGLFLFFALPLVSAQNVYQPNYFAQNQYNNYFANSSAFRQEIARLEIYVVRQGEMPLPITEVPRLEKNDILKVRLLDESVNGLKLNESNYDWTLLVAYINPGRNNDAESSVSEEIQFKKRGWFKEYTFTVPYDSQPVFFLYPKPNYRTKILHLISKNQDEIRKLGEKTIEIAGAYAKIGSFLNELQFVIYRNQYYANSYGGSYGGGYGGYGGYYDYNLTPGSKNYFMEQAVERLARSFNIQLPPCWSDIYGYGYNGYNNSPYNGYNNYNNYGGNGFYGQNNDFTGRLQCVARNVKLEDLDMSVSRMLQQGGIFVAAELTRKYPQIAFWIKLAAVALDFILKLTRKLPLRIVPTVYSASQNQWQNYDNQTQTSSYPSSFAPTNYNSFAPGTNTEPVKISLYAESPPNDNGFVTAYPLVTHNWQANPDQANITLPIPTLLEPCLHTGQNILRSTDVINDWITDSFTRDYKLVISAPNGFRKEFPLRKNVGFSGWELFLTSADLESYPNLNLNLVSEITGRRGFTTIRSPKFELPLPITGAWSIEPETQDSFSVGGKRKIILRNQAGNCRCLQAVVYKPASGGEFIFAGNNNDSPLKYSQNFKEVSFEIDTTDFQPGPGKLDLIKFGGEIISLPLNLNPSANLPVSTRKTSLNYIKNPAANSNPKPAEDSIKLVRNKPQNEEK